MKVSSKTDGPCRLNLTVQAAAEETRPIYREVEENFVRQAQVPGFRRGKAPLEIIRRHHGAKIDADARDILIGQFYRQTLEKEKLEVANVIDIADIVFAPDAGLRFTAKVEVHPEFKLPKYKSISLADETAPIEEETVEQRIQELLRLSAEYEEAPEHQIAGGDLATITYRAEPPAGYSPADQQEDKDQLLSAENMMVQAGETTRVPGLGEKIIGMKSGGETEMEVSFPDDFPEAGLAGKKVAYQVTINSVRRRIVPEMNEEWCKRFGFADAKELREAVRRNLEKESANAELSRRRDEIVAALLKKAKFDLPPSLLALETRSVLQEIVRETMSRGGDRDSLTKDKDKLLEQSGIMAAGRLRLRYILLAIAREEAIEVTDREVDRHVEMIASSMRESVARVRERMDKNNSMPRLRDDILAGKAMDKLLEEAIK